MSTNTIGHNRPVSTALHPYVYRAMVGLALVLILSIWGLSGKGGTDLLLAVISALIFFVVLISTAAWWTWHRHQPRGTFDGDKESFKDWEEDEFATWQGRLSGRAAATQVLLPLAAVSFGMTVFAILAHVLA